MILGDKERATKGQWRKERRNGEDNGNNVNPETINGPSADDTHTSELAFSTPNMMK